MPGPGRVTPGAPFTGSPRIPLHLIGFAWPTVRTRKARFPSPGQHGNGKRFAVLCAGFVLVYLCFTVLSAGFVLVYLRIAVLCVAFALDVA